MGAIHQHALVCLFINAIDDIYTSTKKLGWSQTLPYAKTLLGL
jgi:hypothetical protein